MPRDIFARGFFSGFGGKQHLSIEWMLILEIIKSKMQKEYENILDQAAKEYDSFSLIWRDQLHFDNSAKEIEVALLPYLIENKKD